MKRRLKWTTDIPPVSGLRANAAERMVEEIELPGDVRTAMQQIDAGGAVSNRDAKAELRRRFGTAR